MDLSFLTQFVDANKIGGWVRAGVAAILVAIVAKYPPLGNVLDPSVQTQLAVLIATVAVGLWSQLTKSDAAKLKAAAAIPDVKQIVVNTNSSAPVAAIAADDAHPKVVTQ